MYVIIADGTSVEVLNDKGLIVSMEKMIDTRHSQTLFPPRECLVPHPSDMVETTISHLIKV